MTVATAPGANAGFAAWCDFADDASPAWYTVNRLMELAASQGATSADQRKIYDDCPAAETALGKYVSTYKGSLVFVGIDSDFKDKSISDLRPLAAVNGLTELTLLFESKKV